MSPINWDEMITGLEQQRSGLAQEIADVDAVLETVRRRAAPKVTVASITQPRPKGRKGTRAAKSKPVAKGKRQGLSDDQRATLRTLWENGTDAKAIAARLKISTALLYYYTKALGLKRPARVKAERPNPGAAASPAAAAPIEREKLAGRVRCTSCDLWTETDPCQHCGKKLKRHW